MTPKEDQQPMTTREELDRLADDIALWRRGHAQGSEMLGYILHPSEQLPVIAALRLASRQEVSVTVEELARVIDPIAFGIKPSMYGLRSQQELERHVFVSGVRGVARDKARALLANYAITKRTTEG